MMSGDPDIVDLRSGGKDMKSSGQYPRSYAKFIASEHLKASWLTLTARAS